VFPGVACSVQGVLIQSGDLASALWSLIISVHTFLSRMGVKGPGYWGKEFSAKGKESWIVSFGVWFIAFFLGSIGLIVIEQRNPEKGPFCTFLS